MEKLNYLIGKYESNLVIRGLIQLLPFGIGGTIDMVLNQTSEKIQRERATAFFEELSSGDTIVDESLLKSEDFLHAYFATTKFALNSRRREKIQIFARLLKNSFTEHEIQDIDEYEDYLKILEELSYREIIALKIMDDFSMTPREKEQNDLQWTDMFWSDFEKRLSTTINMPTEQVADFMNRISRTGCYELFTGRYLGHTGGKGKLTPTYQKLKKFIEAKK